MGALPMIRPSLSSVLGFGGIGMLLGGAACFQFYALPSYGHLDHIVALGAGLIGVGGLSLMMSRLGRRV